MNEPPVPETQQFYIQRQSFLQTNSLPKITLSLSTFPGKTLDGTCLWIPGSILFFRVVVVSPVLTTILLSIEKI